MRFPPDERLFMTRLDAELIDEHLSRLTGWQGDSSSIRKSFPFPDFPQAMLFATAIAWQAHRADHHPSLTIDYRKVTVMYTTHSENGVTSKDIEGALACEALAQGSRPASAGQSV